MRQRHTLLGLVIAGLAGLWTAVAAETATTADLPDRRITAALQYPGITLGPDDTLNVDLLIKNRGRSDETVLIEVIEKPEDWTVEIKRYGTVVSGVFVASREDQTLNLAAAPANKEIKKLPPGTYRFAVKAQTSDGALSQSSAIVVTVVSAEKASERVSIETSYPTLRGPSGDKFQFSLDVRNDTGQDAVFNFRATTPPGWEASFKPAYESKQISSLQIGANSSKTVEMEVTPPYNAQAGEYDFKVEAQSPKARAEAEVKVVLTGTYGLKVGTSSGLLSLVTERGRRSTVTLLVQNSGSAAQREVRFEAFKPENWKVEFTPETIEDLEPGAIKQTEISITPAEEALIGDYSISIQTEGEKANQETEFRVTIRAASAWGWIGVGIIAVVILGLAAAFRILGRR
ncbi:MAG TPA: NEW3 domain-containing protein [Verrucomicrobiota bacterium]|nr:NEW3 domain-containing protein [Verrucomicrobiota bacterium]HRZ35562.1 NEW3 domain-containing protein [Candidatus Paceibacterota bacterium]